MLEAFLEMTTLRARVYPRPDGGRSKCCCEHVNCSIVLPMKTCPCVDSYRLDSGKPLCSWWDELKQVDFASQHQVDVSHKAWCWGLFGWIDGWRPLFMQYFWSSCRSTFSCTLSGIKLQNIECYPRNKCPTCCWWWHPKQRRDPFQFPCFSQSSDFSFSWKPHALHIK